MSFTLLRRSEQLAQPWKNSGGVTRTIAIDPPDATLDDFVWRVSAADVDADGPFSPFPGVDRVLVLLAGDGMELWTGESCVRLEAPGELASFPGERPIVGRLSGGSTRDLNIMVRRGQRVADVQRVVVRGPIALAGLVVGVSGDVTVGGQALGCGDAAVGEALNVDGDGLLIAITLRDARSTDPS